MGRKAAFTKARSHDLRQRSELRAQRSTAERDKRRGIDTSERLIQKTAVMRPLPGAADRELLVNQFTEACRLPGPSMDLCTLMRLYAGLETGATSSVGSRKRQREESNHAALDAIAAAFLRTQNAPAAAGDEDENDDDDDGEADSTSILLEVLQDDSGRRVVAALLTCLRASGSAMCDTVAEAVLAQFEENEHLPDHHVACRVMSALVEHGSASVQRRVLGLFLQRGTSTESVRALLLNRHTSVTIEHLLRHVPTETTAWLSEMLGLGAAPVSPKKSAKSKKAPAVDAIPTAELMALLTDAVAGPVLAQLITTSTRAAFLSRLDVQELLATKRGTAFLTRLLTITEGEEGKCTIDAEVAHAMLETLLQQLSSQLAEMCRDKRANFVVQSVIRIVPATGAHSVGNLQRVVRVLGDATLVELCAHGIGVHVLVTLIDTALQLPAEAAEEVGELLLTRHNIAEMLCSQHGSLVVRHLMPLVTRKHSRTGQLLRSAMEQDFDTLVYNTIGNLVVQAYLQSAGAAATSSFARKVAKESEVLNMCRDASASHVVYTLLGVVDPATHTALCTALRPHIVALAIHVNGRFVVERVVAASREVRDEILRHFLTLTQQKGTQHVLTTLVSNLDARGKQALVSTQILPNLSALASHQCGTIVLQKLMQAEPLILKAVRDAFNSNPRMRSDVAQNFYGKFVVQIAHNTE